MSFNQKTSLHRLTYSLPPSKSTLQKSFSCPHSIEGGKKEAENQCQPLSSCHTHWNIAHLSAQKISCQDGESHFVWGSYLCKSCVCFQFHVGATSFTFTLHSRKFMYFLHVIANCTPRSSLLFLLPLMDQVCVTGSCIFHMDQWWRMLITEDYEYLMLQ